MPKYQSLYPKVRKDPLGTQTLSQLNDNVFENYRLATQQHRGDGVHYALEVARSCGTVQFDGGTDFSLVGFNGNVSLETGYYVSPGVLTLTLHSTRFATGATVVCHSNNSENVNVPSIVTPLPTGTTITFYHQQLTDALGAGNTFADVDASFDISLWSYVYPYVSSGHTYVSPLQKTNGLRFGTWNAIADNIAQQRSSLQREHNLFGDHLTYEIPKGKCLIEWDGATDYAIVEPNAARGDSIAIDSIVRNDVGQLTLSLTGTDAPLAFFEAEYVEVGIDTEDIYKVLPGSKSSTTVDIYIYKYDFSAGTWDRADCSFFVTVHASEP